MSTLAAHREQQHLTQEELSQKSGVSVRTIQRIESGNTPKGYTLKALAKALNINEKELLQKPHISKKVNTNFANLINLSSLLVASIPIACFIVPLAIAIIKKELNPLTKQIITVQVIWSFVVLFVYLLATVIITSETGRTTGILILLLLVISNVFTIISNSIALHKSGKLFVCLKTNIF